MILIKGYLKKKSGISVLRKKKYYILYDNGVLVYYDNEEDVKTSSPKGEIVLASSWNQNRIQRTGCEICIFLEGNLNYFIAENEAQAKLWTDAIESIYVAIFDKEVRREKTNNKSERNVLNVSLPPEMAVKDDDVKSDCSDGADEAYIPKTVIVSSEVNNMQEGTPHRLYDSMPVEKSSTEAEPTMTLSTSSSIKNNSSNTANHLFQENYNEDNTPGKSGYHDDISGQRDSQNENQKYNPFAEEDSLENIQNEEKHAYLPDKNHQSSSVDAPLDSGDSKLMISGGGEDIRLDDMDDTQVEMKSTQEESKTFTTPLTNEAGYENTTTGHSLRLTVSESPLVQNSLTGVATVPLSTSLKPTKPSKPAKIAITPPIKPPKPSPDTAFRPFVPSALVQLPSEFHLVSNTSSPPFPPSTASPESIAGEEPISTSYRQGRRPLPPPPPPPPATPPATRAQSGSVTAPATSPATPLPAESKTGAMHIVARNPSHQNISKQQHSQLSGADTVAPAMTATATAIESQMSSSSGGNPFGEDDDDDWEGDAKAEEQGEKNRGPFQPYSDVPAGCRDSPALTTPVESNTNNTGLPPNSSKYLQKGQFRSSEDLDAAPSIPSSSAEQSSPDTTYKNAEEGSRQESSTLSGEALKRVREHGKTASIGLTSQHSSSQSQNSTSNPFGDEGDDDDLEGDEGVLSCGVSPPLSAASRIMNPFEDDLEPSFNPFAEDDDNEASKNQKRTSSRVKGSPNKNPFSDFSSSQPESIKSSSSSSNFKSTSSMTTSLGTAPLRNPSPVTSTTTTAALQKSASTRMAPSSLFEDARQREDVAKPSSASPVIATDSLRKTVLPPQVIGGRLVYPNTAVNARVGMARSWTLQKRFQEFRDLNYAVEPHFRKIFPGGIPTPFPQDRLSTWAMGMNDEVRNKRREIIDGWLRCLMSQSSFLKEPFCRNHLYTFLDVPNNCDPQLK